MSDFNKIIEKLSEPFPPEKIKWRVGSTNAKRNNGKATEGFILAYVDARDVMQRLDDVLGSENWQDKLEPTPDGMICHLAVKYLEHDSEGNLVDSEWIWKSDSAGETNVEEVKGASSDAFKRAGVKFGIGRYLYDLPKQWINLENGRIPKDFNPKLPDWALPKPVTSVTVATIGVPAKDATKNIEKAFTKAQAKKKESPLVSKQAIDIFLKDLKGLNEEDRAAFKIWLKEQDLTFGDGKKGWNLRDSDLERVAIKISELIEPIE